MNQNQSPLENNTSTNTPEKLKGILALIKEPILFYPYDPSKHESSSTNQTNPRKKEKHISMTDDHMNMNMNMNISFTAMKTEFTLFFFCASWCKYSRLFCPTLATFVHKHPNSCQCLVVPNEQQYDLNKTIQRFCYGNGFMCLPEHYSNRAALYRCDITIVSSILYVYKRKISYQFTLFCFVLFCSVLFCSMIHAY